MSEETGDAARFCCFDVAALAARILVNQDSLRPGSNVGSQGFWNDSFIEASSGRGGKVLAAKLTVLNSKDLFCFEGIAQSCRDSILRALSGRPGRYNCAAYTRTMLVEDNRDAGTFSEEEKLAASEQLERLLANPYFSHSRRFPSFLRFIVCQTLSGRTDLLKERTVGVEVFGKDANYDTANDPIVRVTAAEIRKRIASTTRTRRTSTSCGCRFRRGRTSRSSTRRTMLRAGGAAVDAAAMVWRRWQRRPGIAAPGDARAGRTGGAAAMVHSGSHGRRSAVDRRSADRSGGRARVPLPWRSSGRR